MGKYKRYEKYKDSGIEWIGEVPEEWQLIKLNYLVDLINEKTASVNDRSYIGLEQIESKTGKLSSITVDNEEFEGIAILFKPGDVLFSKLRPYLAKCIIAEFSGCCTSELLVLRSKTIIYSKYLFYYILSDNFINIVNSSTYGTKMPRANWNFIRDLAVVLPELGVQHSIANFLDRKTTEIDTLIADKEKLIELLQEKRQAIISEAVTKGLDPNVKMKDSAIEWIGEMPEHWEIIRMKNIFGLRNERNIKAMHEVQVLSLHTALGVKRQEDVEQRGNIVRTVEDYKIVYPNDIVVNIILAWMGAIGMSANNGVISPAYDIYKPNNNVHSKFYHYLFRTSGFSGECYKHGKGIMMMRWRTYSDDFRSIYVVYPPIEEQVYIANYLDRTISETDSLITDIQISIQKLKEYRQSLISETVTGKIDVREE